MDTEERLGRLADLHNALEQLLCDSRLLCAGSRDYRERATALCRRGRKLLGASRQLSEQLHEQALELLERAADEGVRE